MDGCLSDRIPEVREPKRIVSARLHTSLPPIEFAKLAQTATPNSKWEPKLDFSLGAEPTFGGLDVRPVFNLKRNATSDLGDGNIDPTNHAAFQTMLAAGSFANTGSFTLLTHACRAAPDCWPAYRPMVNPNAAASFSCPTASQIVQWSNPAAPF